MHISFDALPSAADVFLDYTHNWQKVSRFYSRPHTLAAIAEFARDLPSPGADHLERLCSALEGRQRGWGGENLGARKLASGAVAVVAGQQPGLFTGPLYSIFKALTAVKIARELEGMDIPAVPVFWIAAEDHDHEEIEWAAILDRDSSLHRIRTDLSDGDRTPVGWLKFGDDVAEAVAACFDILPPSEFHEDVHSVVESAYRPGSSPVDAFARMMVRLFSGTGLVLADPLDSSLRELAEPVLRSAAASNDDIRRAVIGRSGEISEAGYKPQVRVDSNFTGLFTYNGRSRDPVRPDDAVGGSDLSPNVLMRPVVQDSIFSTAAYVGGPAEIAYFAQAAPIYACLGKTMPPVFPRITATLIEPPVARVMKKYGLGVDDLFAGRDQLRKRAVGSIHDARVFEEVRENVSAEIERLRPALTGIDPTLAGALDNSRQKMMHQVESLQTRFVNAETRRNEVLDRHLNTFTNRLFPEKRLQERVVNVTSFLVRYGLGLVSLLDERMELGISSHQIVEL